MAEHQERGDDELHHKTLRKHAFDLKKQGVLRKIEEQDPAITSIIISFISHDAPTFLPDVPGINVFGDVPNDDNEQPRDLADLIDWEAAGRAIGENRHIKCLILDHLCHGMDFQSHFVPFFRGLADNRSIEVLSLSLYHNGNAEKAREIFEIMLPFFANNANLNRIVLCYGGSYWIQESLIRAFHAALALNAVIISKDISEELTRIEEELLDAVLTRSSLRQISFQEGVVINNVSAKIKTLLSDPQCKLKIMGLPNKFEDKETMTTIASGLAANKSVKSLTFTARNPCPLLTLSSNNTTLEKLDLSCNGYRQKDIGVDLAVALKRFKLKSLNLSHREWKPVVWAAIFDAVLTPTSVLEELILNGASLSGDSLKALGEHMGGVKSLRSLDLTGCLAATRDAWQTFFNCLQGPECKVEKMELAGFTNNVIDDTVLPCLIRFLESNSTLKALNLTNCGISRTGWLMLLGMLHRTEIEKISGYRHKEGLALTLLELSRTGKLTNVDFVTSEPLSPGISRILESPNCRLEELRVVCCVNEQRDFLQFVHELVETLRHNSTLKTLSIGFLFRGITAGLQSQFWQECANVLCNVDSINATFNSNHTLCSIELDEEMVWNLDWLTNQDNDDEQTKLEVYSLLHMNREGSNSSIARRKVIRSHLNSSGKTVTQTLIDLNLGFHMMPQLLSWIGREEKEHYIMFDFLRGMPILFEHLPSKKRKRPLK